MGPAQADRALDDPNLAVRVSYRRSSLLNALPMVPSAGALTAIVRCPQRTARQNLRSQNLALNGDLMFDQSDVPPRMKETLW